MDSSALTSAIDLSIRFIKRFNVIFVAYPYNFDRLSGQLLCEPNFSEKGHWKCHFYLLLFVSLCGIFKLVGETSALVHSFVSSFHIFGFSIVAATVYCHYKRSTDLVGLINQLLRFRIDEDFIPESLQKELKWITKGVEFIVQNYVCLALLFGITSAIKPWSDWRILPLIVFDLPNSLLGNHSEKVITHLIEYGQRFISFLVSYLVWQIYSNFSIINVNIGILVPTFSIYCAIRGFERKLDAAKSNRELLRCANIYRQIQIMVAVYNDIHSNYVVPAYIIIGSSGFFYCAYAIVSGYNDMDFGMLAVFTNGIIISAAELVFCFHWAKKINSESERISKNKTAKLSRSRYWKSFPTLKIQFGNNYFERATPLIMLDFSVNQAVSLILMGK